MRDELVENEIRGQGLRARMLETHRIDSANAGAPVFIRREPTDDDEQYQEGATRYRKQQIEYSMASWGAGAQPIDYGRHSCDGQGTARAHRRPAQTRPSIRIAGSALVLVALALGFVAGMIVLGMRS